MFMVEFKFLDKFLQFLVIFRRKNVYIYHIHAAVTRLHSLASADTDTYMDRQADTLGQHNTYLLPLTDTHT